MTSLTLPSPGSPLPGAAHPAKKGEPGHGGEPKAASGFHEVMRSVTQLGRASSLDPTVDSLASGQTAESISIRNGAAIDPELTSLLNRASSEQHGSDGEKKADKRGSKRAASSGSDKSMLNMLQISLVGGLTSLSPLTGFGSASLNGSDGNEAVALGGLPELSAKSPLPDEQIAAIATGAADEKQNLAAIQVVSSRTFLGMNSKTDYEDNVKLPAAGRKAPAKAQALNVGAAERKPEPAATGDASRQHFSRGGSSDALPSAAASEDQANGTASAGESSALGHQIAPMGWVDGATTFVSSLTELPELVSAQATGLVAQAKGANIKDGSAVSVNPVKELEIALDPAELGSISVKLRLASGRLHVTIQVEKPETLRAIESRRDLIAERLGSADAASVTLLLKESDHQITPLAQSALTNAGDGRSTSQQGASNQTSGQDTQRRFGGGTADSGARTASKLEGISNEADVSRNSGSGGLFV